MFLGRKALTRSLRLVQTPTEAHRFVQTISERNVYAVAMDCEGVRLGRFGRLSLIQIMEPCGTFTLVDGVDQKTVVALEPLLSSTAVCKVMHDCREDAAALFHQFEGIRLTNVIDTQVANLLIQREEKAQRIHQSGYNDLVQKYLGKAVHQSVGMKDKMIADAMLWHKRPLSKDLVDYAIEGVEHLLPLWSSLQSALRQAGLSDDDVIKASEGWLDYRHLNVELTEARLIEKIGTPVMGMVAAINDKGVYFKLNIGRTGVCSTPSALKRMLLGSGGFPPVQVGDTVELAVSGLSLDGKIVYVERRDPDWEYFDFQRRPSHAKKGTSVEEYRHTPSLVEDASIDPLLRRGLGEDGGVDSDSDDEVDHNPVLTRKPVKRTRQ